MTDMVCFTTRRFDHLFRLIRWIDGRLTMGSLRWRWLWTVEQRTTDRMLGLWSLPTFCLPRAEFVARYGGE